MNFNSDYYSDNLDNLLEVHLPSDFPYNYASFMNWSSPNKVVVQGIIESGVAEHAAQMKAYGTDIIAGISPGQGGEIIAEIPVFDLVEQVLSITDKIDTSLIFVPPYEVLDAVKEAVSTGIKRVIIFTTNVPPLDSIELIKYAQATGTLILGTGSDGITIPGKVWLGKLEPKFYQPGNVGMITTSKYLSYEVAEELNQASMGQSMVISLGNDRITGSSLSQWLAILDEDPDTEAILFIGQRIKEAEEIVTFCKNRELNKLIVSYFAGLKTPKEIVINDAVSIISNHLSASIPTINEERRILNQLKKAGVKVAKRPSEIPAMLPLNFL